MSTTMLNSQTVARKWYVIDAAGKPLGKTAALAADLLRGKQDFARHYTAEERAQFEAYLEGQVRKVTLPQPDTAFLRERLLTMYANPVFNHEAAVHE